MATIRYSVEPDPAIGGKKAKICYDFNGSGVTSAPTTVSWKPSTFPSVQFTLTTAEPCHEVDVPAGATEGFAVDGGGVSGDLGFLVT